SYVRLPEAHQCVGVNRGNDSLNSKFQPRSTFRICLSVALGWRRLHAGTVPLRSPAALGMLRLLQRSSAAGAQPPLGLLWLLSWYASVSSPSLLDMLRLLSFTQSTLLGMLRLLSRAPCHTHLRCSAFLQHHFACPGCRAGDGGCTGRGC